jgi:adenylate cyclase
MDDPPVAGASGLARLRARLRAVLDGIGPPDEDGDARIQRRLQVGMALASLPAIGAWGLSFAVLGHLRAAYLPFAYCAGTAALLGDVLLRRRFALFHVAHPVLVLALPFALHWLLGGFVGSGGAILWCLVAPVGMTMFGARHAPLGFLAAVVLLLVGTQRDRFPSPPLVTLSDAEASGYFAFNTVGLLGFLFLGARHFLGRIEEEKGRSERLLLNVLPRPIAERLKTGESVIADRFECVTVVFADIVGFTRLSERLSPGELVVILDRIFSAFDELADRHGLEKIKTIGDAYLAAAGLPEACPDHAARAARFALAACAVVDEIAATSGFELAMRTGLHSGEVVAGVIGRRKFSYDLWGDTVNTASRMESHGQAGRVQASAATRALLAGSADFRFTPRGVVAIKGKGEMETYWLERAAPPGP